MSGYFSNMTYAECQDVIESRLFSNDYGTIFNFNKIIYNEETQNEEIVLTCMNCGIETITNLQSIEDGTLSKSCNHCIELSSELKLKKQKELNKIISENNLELISIDENNFYIKCKLCGEKFHLNEDFYEDSDPYEMCCKNWNCMMTLLEKENHWFALGLKSSQIKLLENTFHYSTTPFTTGYEEWFDNLNEFDISFEMTCEKCGCITIGIIGEDYYDCDACFFGDHEDISITKWDKTNNQVTVHCKKCKNVFNITSNQAENEIFDCFECFIKANSKRKICPVCKTENSDDAYHCNNCDFYIKDINRIKNKSQSDYTYWIEHTVDPCWLIWNKARENLTKQIELCNQKHTLEINKLKNTINELYETKHNHVSNLKNKSKCRIVKKFCKTLAETNNLVYLSAQCPNPIICDENCTAYIAELQYIENELNKSTINGTQLSLKLPLDSLDFETIDSLNLKTKAQNLIQTYDSLKISTKEETEKDRILDTSINLLNLSIKTFSVLKHYGIITEYTITIRDLLSQISKFNRSKFQGLEKNAYDETATKLALLGFFIE